MHSADGFECAPKETFKRLHGPEAGVEPPMYTNLIPPPALSLFAQRIHAKKRRTGPFRSDVTRDFLVRDTSQRSAPSRRQNAASSSQTSSSVGSPAISFARNQHCRKRTFPDSVVDAYTRLLYARLEPYDPHVGSDHG